MFKIGQVFNLTSPVSKATGLVRVVGADVRLGVALVLLDKARASDPITVKYDRWIDLVEVGSASAAPDPYIGLTKPPQLSDPVKKRMTLVESAVAELLNVRELIFFPSRGNELFEKLSIKSDVSKDTVRRWWNEYLRCGTTAAMCRTYTRNSTQDTAGGKRGRKPHDPAYNSGVARHNVQETLESCYVALVVTRKLSLWSAYSEMLQTKFDIPEEIFSRAGKGLLRTPELIAKYPHPSFRQFDYAGRVYWKKHPPADKPPARGSRGKVVDEAFAPGDFEIDGTKIQIQLVSRYTRSQLVGVPCVYLIIDKFSTAICGYAISLDNFSWAAAALALDNCFSDKEAIFSRLGLSYISSDWPVNHLPRSLTADRAELVSDMGQRFPISGIPVKVTPSMCPIAKGTVEGTHSHVKHFKKDEIDLPGLFVKFRQRREADGKKDAALTLEEFEFILVEIIMSLNRSPVRSGRLPLEVLDADREAVTRIGLYAWGLENRPGFTREVPPNFAHDFLLTHGTGSSHKLGILYDGEIYRSDVLQTSAWVAAVSKGTVKIDVVYHNNNGGVIYFKHADNWQTAYLYSIDFPHGEEAASHGISFSELKEIRGSKKRAIDQANLDRQRIDKPKLAQIQHITKEARSARRASDRINKEAKIVPLPTIEARRIERTANRAAESAAFSAAVIAPLTVVGSATTKDESSRSAGTQKTKAPEIRPANPDAFTVMDLWDEE
ncbi:hypothetical protein SAMN05216344_11197 [Polaromonas sp. OV174]|uniref:hypothetical protein n=1 Tax=Polaromonas sp. OV174 TaxID=1855300 RepID=UPI0008E88CB2|nr:hypothetical protein [Polaromonas sp. OV174]SFC21609.1 hypothetical protein SAMN05216344_11197 [Polaromonas sp. OV174]